MSPRLAKAEVSASTGTGDADALVAIYRRHARHSTALLTLYRGFEYFRVPEIDGLIAYVDTRWAWVAAGEPVADPAYHLRLLEEFKTAALRRGKSAAFLPVSAGVKQVAERAGYSALYIGAEPWHDVGKAVSAGVEVIKSTHPAKQLISNGASFEAFHPSKVSSEESWELQQICRRWLSTRKSEPIAFLNRLEPWSLPEHKRYYWLKSGGKVLGFLAAVPIWGTGGWYLVDLIRDPDSPIGTTEALVGGATEQLKQEGATAVTLGFSPLAKLEIAPAATWATRAAQRFNTWVYESFDQVYGFRSLYEYKAKFHPDRWEGLYLLSTPGGAGVKTALGIFAALYPQGLGKFCVSWIKRAASRFNVRDWIYDHLSSAILFRALPSTPLEGLQRLRGTLLYACLSVFLYAGSRDAGGGIRPQFIERYGLTGNHLAGYWFLPKWTILSALSLSPFLSPSLAVCSGGFVAVFCLGGALELLVGTSFLFRVFLSAAYWVGPMSVYLSGLARESYRAEYYIGPWGLIFACIGSMAYFTSETKGMRLTRYAGCAVLIASLACFVPCLLVSALLGVAGGYFLARLHLPKHDRVFGGPN